MDYTKILRYLTNVIFKNTITIHYVDKNMKFVIFFHKISKYSNLLD